MGDGLGSIGRKVSGSATGAASEDASDDGLGEPVVEKKGLFSSMSNSFGRMGRSISRSASGLATGTATLFSEDILRMMNFETMLNTIPPDWRNVDDAEGLGYRDDDMAAMFYMMHAFYLHTVVTKGPVERKGYCDFMASITRTLFSNMTKGAGKDADARDTLCFVIPLGPITQGQAVKDGAEVGAKVDGAKVDGAKEEGAKEDGAKGDGAKEDGAKGDGAKEDGAKGDGAKEDGAQKEGEGGKGDGQQGGGKMGYAGLVSGIKGDGLEADLTEKATTADSVPEGVKILCALFYSSHSWCKRATDGHVDVYNAVMEQLHDTLFDISGVRLVVPNGTDGSHLPFVLVASDDATSSTKHRNPFTVDGDGPASEVNANILVVNMDSIKAAANAMFDSATHMSATTGRAQSASPQDPTPEAGEKTPEAGEKTPEAGEKSPEGGEKSPEAGEKTPEAGEKSPEAGEKTPEAGEKTPEGGEKAGNQSGGALLSGLFGKKTDTTIKDFADHMLHIDGYGETDGKWNNPFITITNGSINLSAKKTPLSNVREYAMTSLFVPT